MSNISKALTVAHPEDVAELRSRISLLYGFSDIQIERLYDAFSGSRCAGWLIVDESTMKEFTEWLHE